MDCRTALNMLEAARPDSDDWHEPDLAAAVRHLEGCPRCGHALRARQAFDRNVSRVLGDVPLPADLEDRILHALADRADAHPGASSAPLAAAPASPQTTGRRMPAGARLAIAAAVLVLIGASFWGIAWLSRPALRLESLLADLAAMDIRQAALLPEFDGDPRLTALPDGGWDDAPIWLMEPPRGLPRLAHPHPAALYLFHAELGTPQPVVGMLLAVDRRALAAAPTAESMSSGTVDYLLSGGRRFAVVSWSAGDVVYVCGVEGGGDVLESLQRALERPPA